MKLTPLMSLGVVVLPFAASAANPYILTIFSDDAGAARWKAGVQRVGASIVRRCFRIYNHKVVRPFLRRTTEV